jgi:hypothetical protein
MDFFFCEISSSVGGNYDDTAFCAMTPCILIDHYSSPLKMEAAGSSATFVTMYQTPRHRTPEDSNVKGFLDDIVPVFVWEKRESKFRLIKLSDFLYFCCYSSHVSLLRSLAPLYVMLKYDMPLLHEVAA